MKTYRITQGTRVVVINEYGPKRFDARLYVNGGETVTLLSWKGKTKQGAEKWAARELQRSGTTQH